jgi:hypothetical protein
MISSIVTRSSAAVLCCGGFALLFGPDVVLGALAPGMPPDTWWLGQLLAGAWLALAGQNWLQRSIVIGGIYARPLVYSNFVLYLISALSLVRVIATPSAPRALLVLAVPMVLFAIVYAALLLRGPFDTLQGNATSSAT